VTDLRIGEEIDDDEAVRNHVIIGGVLVLLSLIDYATAEDLRTRFPDLPDTSTM
jgi:hypothetical protein